MHFLKMFLLIVCVGAVNCIKAQNYQSVNGSVYAGSLAPSANPASIVHVPYSWDVTPFAFQFKQSTNAFILKKFSFLSPSGNAELINNFGKKDIRLGNRYSTPFSNASCDAPFNFRGRSGLKD